MVYTLTTNVTVPAAGTPVRLSATRVAATWVLAVALDNNVGVVYVGGVDSSSKQAAGVLASGRRGIPLLAGDSFMFQQSAISSPYDLHEMWLDAATNNDGVSVTYLVR